MCSSDLRGSYHHGDLKAVILAHAADLVAERGADGVSLRELARTAGVPHAAPAHHFVDRRGLFTAPAAPGAAGESPVRMTATRQRVLDVLAGGPPRPATELAREAAVGPGVVRSLAKAGVLRQMTITPQRDFPVPDWRRQGPVLSAAQNEAASALRETVECGDGEGANFSVTLLDGVTGSGKTEVYFEAVAAALKRGKQVLVLVPEIALAGQWLERFTKRFGTAPAAWHSNLAQGKRRAAWRAVAEHGAHVVVGARSALFLPFPDLGLVVVDEEHEAAYKQEEGVIYHARDMAVVRGREAACPVVLASATPSLETTVNVEEGRYERVHLPDRHGGAVMPEVTAIDMRAQGPETGQWLSPPLREALAATFASGEQAMLFLNRRGYAPLTLCRTCGHRFSCPNCTAWLVTHRAPEDRKSTRLNSSHVVISYAVFCLQKKKKT